VQAKVNNRKVIRISRSNSFAPLFVVRDVQNESCKSRKSCNPVKKYRRLPLEWPHETDIKDCLLLLWRADAGRRPREACLW